jgi:hypothetical protein
VFVPHKYVSGFNVPQGQIEFWREIVGKGRRFRRTAKAELAKRGS